MPNIDFGLPLSPAPSPVPSLRRLCIHAPTSQAAVTHQEDLIVSHFAQLDAEAQVRVLKRLISTAPREVLLAAQDEIAPRLRHDPFRVLPIEISLRVLSYINDPKSLAAAAQVSRLWYFILNDDSTWKQLCAAHHFRRLSAAGSFVHPWTTDTPGGERQSSQAIEDSPGPEPAADDDALSFAAQAPPAESLAQESLIADTQARAAPVAGGSSLSSSGLSSRGSSSRRSSSSGMREGAVGPAQAQDEESGALLNSSSLLDATAAAAVWDAPTPASGGRRLRNRASFGPISGPASAITGFSRFRWQYPPQQEPDSSYYAERYAEREPSAVPPDVGEPGDDELSPEDASVAAYYDPAACVSSPALNYRAHFAQQYALNNAWAHGGRLAARYRLPNQTGVIVTTVVMKDGYIATALDTSRILVFSDDGKLLRSLYGHVMGVWALALSGKTLVSGGCDRDVREWDLATGACSKIMRGHSSTVRCLAMAGSNLALSGGRDAIIRVWDLKNGKSLHRLVSHSGSVRRLEVVELHGRKLAVSASYDSTAKVWDIESGQLLYTLAGHANQIYSLAVSGLRIATGSLDHTIRIWDLATGECLATLQGHSALVGQLQMRGSTLVSGGSDGAVRVWDLDQKRCVHRIAAHDNSVTSLQFNDERIVTGGPDCRVQIWNTRTGEHVRQLDKPGVSTVWGVAFRDDRLLSVYSEGTAIVVELLSFVPV